MFTVTHGIATNQGGRDANADAAAVHRYGSGDATAAVVVDGTGDDPDVIAMVGVAAEVIARTAARTTPLAGIMAATAMTSDPAYLEPIPDGVAVCVVVAPDSDTRIAWVGDCRAYIWDGATLHRVTDDHTVGHHLRLVGAGEAAARPHDNWIRTSLALATIGTVSEVRIEVTPPLLVLTSDGVHDTLSHEQMAGMVREHADDPTALTGALVAAAVAEPDGDDPADNATALALLIDAA